VSYDYASSFEEEKTALNINDESVKKLANGDKKSKVLETLGHPGGESIFPVVTPKGYSLLRYTYLETYRIPFVPAPKITTKKVVIKFDASDSVVDISTSESKPD
jgi:outer membrane protein assembly factor BamE (lipoprotein component of BamABCDE complex)